MIGFSSTVRGYKPFLIALLVSLCMVFGSVILPATAAENGSDDDLLGGEAKGGKTVTVDDDDADDAPEAAKEDKKKAKGDQDSDIIDESPKHKLPRAFAPIPRLILIEGKEFEAAPAPNINIAPPEQKPKDSTIVEPGAPVKAEDPIPIDPGAMAIPNTEEDEEIPLDAGLDELDALDVGTPAEDAPDLDNEPKVWVVDKTPRKIDDTVRTVNVVTRDEIGKRTPMRMSDVLLEEPGAWMIYDAPNYGYPVLRGQGLKSTALIIDGVRVTTPAFYVLGGTIGLDFVEPESVEQMELLRGPNSVRFGGSAAGGVLYLHSRKSPTENGENAALKLRFSAADSSIGLRGEITGAMGRLSWFVGGGGETHGDLVAGRGTGEQASTAYDAYHTDGALAFNFTKDALVRLGFQYYRTEDMQLWPGVGLGSGVKDVFDPAYRSLVYLTYEHKKLASFVPWLKLTVSLQASGLSNEYIPSLNKDQIIKDDNDIFTIGVDGETVFDFGKWSRITLGVSYYRDVVASKSITVNTATDASFLNPRSLPDGASVDTIGAFVTDELNPVEGLKINAGFRWEHYMVDADYATVNSSGTEQNISLDEQITFGTFAVGGGLSYNLMNLLTLSVDVSQGFRAPTLDEMLAYRYIGNNWYTPNLNLDPEKTLTAEAGVKLGFPNINLGVTYFFSYMTDAILPNPIAGQYENSDTAMYPQGVEVEANVSIDQYYTKITYSYTHGSDADDSAMSLIPPHQGSIHVGWRSKSKKYWVEAYSKMAAQQDRLSGYDTANPFIPLDGTPGWYTLNLRGGARIGDWAEVSASITNILDRNYRLHGSSMNMPGRSFNLRLNAWF